jgi:hypothetical protein
MIQPCVIGLPEGDRKHRSLFRTLQHCSLIRNSANGQVGDKALYTRVAVNTVRDIKSPLERLGVNLTKRAQARCAAPVRPERLG